MYEHIYIYICILDLTSTWTNLPGKSISILPDFINNFIMTILYDSIFLIISCVNKNLIIQQGMILKILRFDLVTNSICDEDN